LSVFADWLGTVQQHGVKMGLERVRGALDVLGNPQRSHPSILVAGTNGKGSTVAFASALLRAAGHRVGSTFSPHLVDYRERFRLDGRLISPEELEAVGARLQGELAHRPELSELTFFELGTLVASAWFAEREVDVAVLEVGMGGEFDASRAGESEVVVLTNVDLDHQSFLGATVDEIAGTKARAVSPGGVLVSTEDREDRRAAIEAAASEATLQMAGRDFQWTFEDGLNFERGTYRMDQVSLGMPGAHQGANAAAALAGVLALCERTGLTPPDPWQAASALQTARLPGRLDRVRSGPGRPAVLLDGAHNPASARALAAALVDRRRPASRTWLFACMADKDFGPLIDALLPHVDRVVCARGVTSDRFADPEVLKAEVEARGGKAEASGTVEEALLELLKRGSSRDEVLVAGSLYAVGDARRTLGIEPS
jgi:dihydrofolate synthase / folylpolyglutamate synthase